MSDIGDRTRIKNRRNNIVENKKKGYALPSSDDDSVPDEHSSELSQIDNDDEDNRGRHSKRLRSQKDKSKSKGKEKKKDHRSGRNLRTRGKRVNYKVDDTGSYDVSSS